MFMQDFTRLAPVHAVFGTPPATTGLAAGTPVEARNGWQRVEGLRPGDAVHTLDGGLRKIAAMDRAWLLPAMRADILHLPGGAFGNCGEIALLPDQHVLLDLAPCDPSTGGLPDALGVLIPASTLDGHHGITRQRARMPLEIITLFFAEEELVWGASGVLLHCPAVRHGAGALPEGDIFPRIAAPVARRLLAARADERDALPGWVA